jgi:hypothetical protein
VSCDEAPAGGVLAKVWEFEGLVRDFLKKSPQKYLRNTKKHEETRRNTKKHEETRRKIKEGTNPFFLVLSLRYFWALRKAFRLKSAKKN